MKHADGQGYCRRMHSVSYARHRFPLRVIQRELPELSINANPREVQPEMSGLQVGTRRLVTISDNNQRAAATIS